MADVTTLFRITESTDPVNGGIKMDIEAPIFSQAHSIDTMFRFAAALDLAKKRVLDELSLKIKL